MRGRAHSKTLRTQRNKINVKARAFNKAANSRKQSQCAGARIQQNLELKQRMSMCGRAHSKKNANSSKQYQCEGANIQRNRELNQTRLMRGCALKRNLDARTRALNKPQTQANKINARARACKETANPGTRAFTTTANSSK